MTNTYKELQNYYQTWLATLGFSQSVIYNYPKMLYYFLEYLENQSIFNINQLATKNVNNYFTHLQTRQSMRGKKALGIPYLNKSFDAIDKFLEFLHHRGCESAPLPTNFRILQTQNDALKKIKALGKEEIKLLYQSTADLFPYLTFKKAEPRQALATLILDLCYGCGLRKSEAVNLLVEDVDLDKKILFVRQGKGYKDRYVPMGASVCGRVKIFIYQYRSSFGAKHKHKRLFPLTKHALPYYLKLMIASSSIKGISLHTLRHSIATHLLQNGMGIEQIAKFLGHGSLESTQIYTHLAHTSTSHNNHDNKQ